MLKKLFFLILISLINIEFFSNKAYADCNFKTGNFSEKLSKPNSIKNIIKVNNSKVFYKCN